MINCLLFALYKLFFQEGYKRGNARRNRENNIYKCNKFCCICYLIENMIDFKHKK